MSFIHSNALRLGLVLNPLAGIGGPAGLKGSDAPDTFEKASQRGVVSQVSHRVEQVLEHLKDAFPCCEFFTASGAMGADVLAEFDGVSFNTIYNAPSHSSAQDTQKAALAMLEEGVDLLLFAGGDGTARDICQAVGEKVPVLGIPAGVKMHSGVFAVTPKAAASIIHSLLSTRLVAVAAAEVRDIDETAFAKGQVRTRYFGELQVPDNQRMVQKVKCSGLPDDALLLEELATYVSDMILDDDALWILGSGGTLHAIKEKVGIEDPTLLGVDIWFEGECVQKDAHEAQVYEWVKKSGPTKILLSVIGGQGIVLGRGNQQVSARVVEAAGLENLLFVSTQEKLMALDGQALQVDSGSPELDARLKGLRKVICGYDEAVLYPFI